MHIDELNPPAPPPAWKQRLQKFWSEASDQERLDMQVTLRMGDAPGARRLLESWHQALAEKKRRKKSRKSAKKKRRFTYGMYGGWFYPGFHNDSGADSSSDGADSAGDGGGGESIHEQTESDHDIIQRFAASCGRYLGLENMPEVKLRRDPEWTRRHGTFGRYTAEPHNRIELATAGRHIIDILRTLAHEMTHAAQNEKIGLPDHAGETGSEFEDGANAMAGRIMRHWAESEPELFAGVELDEDWRRPAGAAAAAACIAGTPGCATTGTTAADALRTIQTIGRTAQNLPTRAGAEEELRQRVKDELRRRRGEVVPEDHSVTEARGQIKLGPQLFVDRQTTMESLKPRAAAWTSTAERTSRGWTSEWVEWCKDNMAQWVSDTGIMYDVAPGARILLIRNDRDLVRIANRYGLDIKTPLDLFEKMDWNVLRQDYDAIHHRPQGRDYFMSAWDVESTAWFDRKFLTNPRKVKVDTGKNITEASGYIPTEAERNDPRFSMALTQDIRPGETGRQANKLGLKTNSQGRPALLMKKLANQLRTIKEGATPVAPVAPAQQRTPQPQWPGKKGQRPDGGKFRDVLKRAMSEDQELTEVDMSPGALQKWARSDAAQRIRVGFEFEMYFPGTADADRDDDYGDFDYEMDEEANSIRDIIEFFGGGNNPTPRGVLNRVEEGLYETFAEWRQEQIADEASSSGFYDYMEENEPDLREDKIEEFRQEARTELGDDASEEAVDERTQDLYVEWVNDQYSSGGRYYDNYMEWLSDSLGDSYDESDWLRSEMRYMSDVAQEEDLEWPWLNERGGGSGRTADDWADELAGVIGMPVRTGSYHGSRRGEDHANLEPDGSLSEPDSDQDAGLELITPYRPLPEAMQILNSVIEWADRNGIYTNSTTGLHMNVSIEDVKNVDWVKLVLFLGDRYILDQFDRRYKMYASSSLDRIEAKIRDAQPVQEEDGDQAIYGGRVDIEKALQMMRNNSIELARQAIQSGGGREKYQSVHVKELRDGGSYIEFRGPGNDWLQKAQETERGLADTVYRLGRAMTIAADPEAEREEYARKLYKILTPEDPNKKPSMKLFADYSAGAISREELKRAWAEQVLRAQRQGRDRDAEAEYDVVDRDTGEVIDTFTAQGDSHAVEKARDRVPAGTNYDVRLHDREAALSPKERRRGELALRVASKPIWWRVVDKTDTYKGWVQARTASKAIDEFMHQNPEAMRLSRDRFEARPDEPPPLEQTPLPDELKDRKWYQNIGERHKNWALVDRDGEIRYRFQAADQAAAQDRLRSYQAERPERKNNRWLVPLLPPEAESDASPRGDLADASPRGDLGDNEFRVTWQETRSVNGEVSTVSPSMIVTAPSDWFAVDRVRNALNAQGRGPYNMRAEPISSNAPSAVDLNALPPGESDFMVTWDEFRTHEGREVRVTDGVRVTARNAAEASRRVHDSLQMQGREAFNVNAEPTDPPPWRRNRDAPAAATDNITNPLHQTTGEWTGRWLVQSTVTGETVHTISGIGNVQADANRHAEHWVRSTGFDDPIEVVPELQ